MSDGYCYKVSASGRVNIIGEHVDYCGGKVLPAALQFKNNVFIKPNGTDKINVCWSDLDEKISLDINALEKYASVKYANYIAGSLYEWKKAGNRVIGADMLLKCDLPFGGGLSSSAAIEVSAIAAMCAVTGAGTDKIGIALAAQRAERNYVGVNCGIMDQFASACGVKGHAMLLDCSNLSCEHIPVDLGEYSLVISNSGKPHDLKNGKYNERRAETEEALFILKKELDVSALADLSPKVFDNYGKKLLRGDLFDRAKHVVYECDRVKKAVSALRRGDAVALGKLLNESHGSLRDLYKVTGRELDSLQKIALDFPYCIGSRMTGAGFGGCTVSLVKSTYRRAFEEYVSERYKIATGLDASFYQAEADDGITIERSTRTNGFPYLTEKF